MSGRRTQHWPARWNIDGRLGRPALRLAVVASQAATAVVLASPSAHAVAPISPAEQVVIVTANLQEAYGPADVADSSDIAGFIRPVTSLMYRPDVLLLQEVRHSSAAFVARRLSVRTGSRYAVVVDPGDRPAVVKSDKKIFKETAIVVNLDTIDVGSGGYVASSYTKDQSALGELPAIKKHAYVLARESGSSLTLPLASVHFTPRRSLRSKAISDRLRKRWSNEVADLLKTKYGASSNRRTIGGDFNSGRCLEPMVECTPAPFWASLTSESWRYRDSIQDLTKMEGVDYVFTHGGVHEAGVGPRGSYSDHRFRWAIIGNDVTAPSTPINLGAGSGDVDVQLSWTDSVDAATGVRGYEIWRKSGTRDFRLLDRSPTATYLDTNTWAGRTYTYFIVAYDHGHNRSVPSENITTEAYRD